MEHGVRFWAKEFQVDFRTEAPPTAAARRRIVRRPSESFFFFRPMIVRSITREIDFKEANSKTAGIFFFEKIFRVT